MYILSFGLVYSLKFLYSFIFEGPKTPSVPLLVYMYIGTPRCFVDHWGSQPTISPPTIIMGVKGSTSVSSFVRSSDIFCWVAEQIIEVASERSQLRTSSIRR